MNQVGVKYQDFHDVERPHNLLSIHTPRPQIDAGGPHIPKVWPIRKAFYVTLCVQIHLLTKFLMLCFASNMNGSKFERAITLTYRLIDEICGWERNLQHLTKFVYWKIDNLKAWLLLER
ncbi:hypothetical protein DPMN_102515 [Dreissena polymorpha]|uniref:Uncharacterized protein n=1 Tax=Dreissena polymorpha TaxID=45954 RepID=A0A9D4RAY1_DREPO|nr:hypothetical protein DPMN_102515 [Dreissena polymorpha]